MIDAFASQPVNQVANSSNSVETLVSSSSTGSSDIGRFNCHARAPLTFTALMNFKWVAQHEG